MPRVVVVEGRALPNVDPARVWAFVADLTRLPEWVPVHSSGAMTAEAPAVGHAFFVTLRRGRDPKKALTLRVAEWEAGSRYACDVLGSSLIADGRFEVTVTGVPRGGADTEVTLRFQGEVSQWAYAVVQMEARRRLRKALDRLERAFR